ncbi:MAG: class C sortase [Gemmiger sp.]
MKKKHRQTISTILLVLVFLVGLSLLLYPTVSDYWNSLHQSRAIASYAEQVATLDNAAYDALWAEARAYNDTLRTKTDRFTLTDEELAEYNATLNVPGTNVIGYIEIPKIDCYLPIYHGTDEATLQVGVGHLEGSSLPVGGAGTHCVLSGHRGLPSAKLFTDLDQLAEGDTFVLYVLDETLTYEVDQIRIVEPQEVDELAIEDGQDYCTLVTCTPYGINTHRLLVRGHRVENAETGQAAARVSADAMQVDTAAVAPLVAVPLLLLLLFGLLFKTRRRRRPRKPNPPDPKR